MEGESFYFHHGWRFLLADVFPLKDALEKWKDSNGHFFYDKNYEENGWKDVTLPHTYNDVDLFRDRIQDAGSGQKRTCAFYRNWLDIPASRAGQKVFIEFEGMRQTCYLYVNGKLAGYYEAGTAPFGFDLTSLLTFGEKNLIAIATDNTTTRNISFCIAETPNKSDVEPGSYLFSQDVKVPEEQEGVGFFWNCNDFNPSVGGITRPVKLHFKPQVYLTLPLYSNLQTKGVYVYGEDYNIEKKQAKIKVQAEIRNESSEDAQAYLEVVVRELSDDNSDQSGKEIVKFQSEKSNIPATGCMTSPLSITPEDAYKKEILPSGKEHYIAEDEDKVAPTKTESVQVTVLEAGSEDTKLRFWSIDDPYLYQVEVKLFVNGKCVDTQAIETGFRKVGYDKDKGLLINDVSVWLTGYAQRSANEWAAIGIAPEWLKDKDAKLIRESNANHIRFMHVAASPADVRTYDRHGIVCTQPAGDKERENFGRQWDQRVELMRDIIIAFRNHPSILFWEAGNNAINKEHMREMRLLKEQLDPTGGRFMGCRTINTEDVLVESEYVGTMLNRHAARFLAEHGPVTETEYSREEGPRRIWDDYTPPFFDYKNKWIGKGGKKEFGKDFYDLTSEDLALAEAKGYNEFFNDRIGGASKHNWYSACAALCWTDSAQHGRQSFSENGRMSGRVDPVRIKKQNFTLYQVMQSTEPKIKIVGHWNYPKEDGVNYKYAEKKFNGNYWEETGEFSYRDPKTKTVYVFGSYDIAKIVLKVNGVEVGTSVEPIDTFVFPFPNVDVTQSGAVEAYGYDFDGKLVSTDRIETCGAPAKLKLTTYTSPKGLLADGADVAYVDVEVLDEQGRICPICDEKITFAIEGEAEFLGGYNSGRFAGFDKDDSVIHENHVYAECGLNRVFLRSTRKAGKIVLKASMQAITSADMDPNVATTSMIHPELNAIVEVESKETDLSVLTKNSPVICHEHYEEVAPVSKPTFLPIEKADAAKYKADDHDMYLCKILVNGQEPDTRSTRTMNKNGSIWGAVLCIITRLADQPEMKFTFNYDEVAKKLTINDGDQVLIAEVGRTALLVNGVENLMDGEPYLTSNGILMMEVNAIVSYIHGVKCYYDERINVLRIETR